jgi:hypothetical protein
MPRLLAAMRDHLIAQGIVRKPSVVGSAPPLWVEPALGTPAPGEGQGVEVGDELVLASFLTGGIAPDPYGSWHRQVIVDMRLRAKRDRPYLAEDVELAITKALIDRRDWMMAGLYVVESEQWRALQRLGSDEQGYEYVCAYTFELLRE